MNSHSATERYSAAVDQIVLRTENLCKTYGSVEALKGVDLYVRRGTIHGLLGENGAGKSTLVGIISGQRRPSTGGVYIDGQLIEQTDVRTMERAGVFLVTQEPMIVDHLSAAENLFLGIWPARRGLVNWRKLRAEAEQILDSSGIAPDAMAGRLNAVARRKLNILRAMFSGGRIIILDEPTAALTDPDRRQLFEFMKRLQATGVTFIFISHYNDEILEICDAVSVLRDGQLVGGSEDVSTMTSSALSELVLGRGLALFDRERIVQGQRPIGVTLRDVRGKAIDLPLLQIAQGEILGFTGLPGAGAKELAQTLFGLLPAKSGTISFGNDEPLALPRHPHEAFTHGIGYLSDDRRRDGAVGGMSIGDNISLSSFETRARFGFINDLAESKIIKHYFSSLGIKAPDATRAVDTLSGGNQQKVCLGRVLATRPRILILDEPTRGIDVGVKQDVLRIVDGLSREGICVIIVSTDTDELVRAVDRVCMFKNGRVVEMLAGDQITNERLRVSR